MMEETDSERNEIRDELSKMSFEDLQKLKTKLGAKTYNEAMFGSTRVVQTDFKRANKNRPREVSSKKVEHVAYSKTKSNLGLTVRDPRFDSLCGTFDERKFKSAYGFIDEIRQKEKAQLVRQLKKEDDPLERKKIRGVLQRLRNKERDEAKKEAKGDRKLAEIEEKVRTLKEGKKPFYRSKLESKVVDLVDQYSQLKSSGKLLKHIEKKRKKQSQRERKTGVMDSFNPTRD